MQIGIYTFSMACRLRGGASGLFHVPRAGQRHSQPASQTTDYCAGRQCICSVPQRHTVKQAARRSTLARTQRRQHMAHHT
eukprot:scaffold35213_cov107-Isochrysis_galbana.AAC.1